MNEKAQICDQPAALLFARMSVFTKIMIPFALLVLIGGIVSSQLYITLSGLHWNRLSHSPNQPRLSIPLYFRFDALFFDPDSHRQCFIDAESRTSSAGLDATA
jgi:hypothetical protein